MQNGAETPGPTPMNDIPHTLQLVLGHLRSVPGSQALLLVLFLAFSIVSINGVFALHYRRVGRPVFKSILSPASFPILDFNAREWMLLAIALALSLGLGALAVLAG